MGISGPFLWMLFGALSGLALPVPASALPSSGIHLAKNNSPRKRLNISRTFREGMVHYEKEKYREAAGLFSRILKEYPGHEPSRLQLAKTLYRMGKGSEAYDIFKSLNPKFFDPETAYEYAHVYFAKSQWDGSLNAFKKVPKGHALYDLASFYGAICAFKLERYQEADEMMDNAVVLPSKLIKSRALYRKSISDILMQKQREEVLRQKAEAIAKLREGTRSHEENLLKKQIEEEKARSRAMMPPPPPPPPPPPQPYGFFLSQTRANAGIRITQQTANFNTLADQNGSFRDSFFHFSKGAVGPMLRRAADVGGDYLYQLDLMVMDHNFNGPTWQIAPTVEEEIADRYFQSLTGNSSVKAGSGSFLLGAEHPLGRGLWLGATAKWLHFFPELESGQSAADARGELFIGQNLPESQWTMSLQYHQLLQHDGKPWYNVSVQELTSSYVHEASQLGFRVLLNAQQYGYDLEPTDGPENTYRVKGAAFALFPYAAELGIEGIGLWEEGMRRYDIGNLTAMVFDRRSVSGTLYAHVSPLPWLTLKVAGLRQQRDFARVEPPDEASRQILEADQFSFLSQSTLTVTANLLF